MRNRKLLSVIVIGLLVTSVYLTGCNNGTELDSKNVPEIPEEADIYVEPVSGISKDFIRGIDVSEVLVEEASGVTYKDLDGTSKDVFDIIAENGANYVRIRIWNDPYDENGNGYGGGNNDVQKAIELGRRATQYGMKVLIDFHYSDFWADPDRQLCPKAWENMPIEEKSEALYDFTYDSLSKILDAKVDVAMVQVGNETNSAMSGEKDLGKVRTLMKEGARAIRDINAKYNKDIKVVLHLTNATNHDQIKGLLDKYQKFEVDYDILGLSYYPYWHGSFEKLAATMDMIRNDYQKDVMIVETAFPYTTEDGDGYSNSVYLEDDSLGYTSSVQSQSNEIRDICELTNKAGGLGVFYWGATWVPVNTSTGTAEELWEKEGSGWASKYAKGYDPKYVGDYYGGNAWDNQALFDFDGKALPSLATFKYLEYGSIADERIDYIPEYEMNVMVSDSFELPSEIPVVLNNRREGAMASVAWDEDAIAKVDTSNDGDYIVEGVTDSGEEVSAKIHVGYINMAINGDFEGEDTSMWNVYYEGANPTDYQDNETDAHSGSMAFHFWSTSDMDFGIEQTLTDLESGTYGVSVFSQGGDMNDDCELVLYAIADGKEYTVDFKDAGWANWQNPEIKDIPVSGGEITFGVKMKCNAKSWGTIDDFSVFRMK